MSESEPVNGALDLVPHSHCVTSAGVSASIFEGSLGRAVTLRSRTAVIRRWEVFRRLQFTPYMQVWKLAARRLIYDAYRATILAPYGAGTETETRSIHAGTNGAPT